MGVTAESGPFVVYGATYSSTAGTGVTGRDMENNPQRGPSLFDLSLGMMDPRVAYGYKPGSGVTTRTLGFYQGLGMVDFVPAAANSSAFTISSNTVSTGLAATAFTLLSSQTGITQTTIKIPENGTTSGNLLCIDSTAVFLTFGTDDTIGLWNPSAGAGRGIVITTSSSGERGGMSVYGRDIYGYEITETIHSTDSTRASTNSSGLTLRTRKAYKYISSIVNASTVTSTGIGIGFSDRFGFPIRVDYAGDNLSVRVLPTAYSSAAGAVGISSASAILASTAATATSTTDDVRGTYTSTTASDGTLRIQFTVTPSASGLATVTSTNVSPIFGVTQYSST